MTEKAPKKGPLWLSIEKINERLDVIEKQLTTQQKTNESLPTSPEIARVEPKKSEYPIPPDFIETVDLVLNKNFVIRCEPLPDSPAFQFTIVVPEKYSPLSKEQKEMIHEDMRTKVIPYSEGVNGVRLWSEKVYSSFNSDTQFRIVEDRPFASRPL